MEAAAIYETLLYIIHAIVTNTLWIASNNVNFSAIIISIKYSWNKKVNKIRNAVKYEFSRSVDSYINVATICLVMGQLVIN